MLGIRLELSTSIINGGNLNLVDIILRCVILYADHTQYDKTPHNLKMLLLDNARFAYSVHSYARHGSSSSS